MEYKVNEVVLLKKKHPCNFKSNSFSILSIDGEVRLKCCGCGGVVILKRNAFEKSIKSSKKVQLN